MDCKAEPLFPETYLHGVEGRGGGGIGFAKAAGFASWRRGQGGRADFSRGQAIGFKLNERILLAESIKSASFCAHMRNFLSSLLGSLTAIVVFFTGLSLCGLFLLLILASAGQQDHSTSVQEGSYLHLKLDMNLNDAPTQDPFASLMSGEKQESVQLRSALKALHAAANDKRIAGMVITGSLQPADYGSSYASLQELREAILAVKQAGKPVIAYINDSDTRDYFLASAADEVVMDPYGMILLPGLGARPMFYAGAFEKYGVGVQYTRVGKYKSAIEPYTRKNMSPENKEQLGTLLGDLWTDLIGQIARSRDLEPAAVQEAADNEALISAQTALKLKLIDRVLYRDELLDELKTKTGVTDPKKSFKQIALADYIQSQGSQDSSEGTGRVAVVYAEGVIVDGAGETGQIGGATFSKELRRLRQDDSVKAIVLRVNSPGGSAAASEMIQRELRLAREKKPVVVSMGGYAASGGYWISAYGTKIYAEPTTITGSIGVFGLFFDVEKLAGSVGLSFDTVKTGRHADVFTMTRPKTPEELRIIQKHVDWIYEEFLSKVSEARTIDRKVVEEIAQGRVWSGTAALKLKLVDEIGGLEAAIIEAGKLSGLGSKPAVSEYPKKKELGEFISDMLNKMDSSKVRTEGFADKLSARLKQEYGSLNSFNDPRGIYLRMPADLLVE